MCKCDSKFEFALERVENIVGKEKKKCWLQIYSLSTIFSKGFVLWIDGSHSLCGKEFNPFSMYTHFNTWKKKTFGKHCGKR